MQTLTDSVKNTKNDNEENQIPNLQSSIYDINKIKDFSAKSVDLIFEEKIDNAFELLKKIEAYLETNAIETTSKINNQIIITILHNLSCCYQKKKDFVNCFAYLEAVIYHFDTTLEIKHNLQISENYFINLIDTDQSSYSLLGDLILELRFSAKFHLQMCAVLSQLGNHYDALKHGKLSTLMCEDNLIKTYFLYKQMKAKDDFNKTDDDFPISSDKLKQSFNIINDLYNRVLQVRNATNSNDINFYDSYIKYRKGEIANYILKANLTNNIRNIFGDTIKKDDWIQLLNIGNIMFLSALNYDDLDLDSDPKYELLRDAILEKIVMLTVAYFCITTEIRHITSKDDNLNKQGEFYHYKAIEFAALYLPVSCPIVKHYIISYYKHYGNDMNVIPEGEVSNMKIELLRSEIEQDKDVMTFVTIKKVGYSGVRMHKQIEDKNRNRNANKEKEIDLINNNILSIKTKIQEEKAPKFKLNLMSINQNFIDNNTINIKEKSFGSHIIINKNDASLNNNNNSKNNSEHLIIKRKSRTERPKIGNVNVSKYSQLYIQNHLSKENKKKVGRKKCGSVTERTHSSNAKVKQSNKSKEKSQSKREFHSTELLFKTTQGKISKNSMKEKNNSKNTIDNNNKVVKYKKSDNNNKIGLTKIKKDFSCEGFIEKLLASKMKIKEKNAKNYPLANMSLNSLLKVIKPKKK